MNTKNPLLAWILHDHLSPLHIYSEIRQLNLNCMEQAGWLNYAVSSAELEVDPAQLSIMAQI